MISRPLLASPIEQEDLPKLRYPVFVSEKLDGFRCLIHPERGAVARSFKPIPNHHVYEELSNEEFNGFDGELTLRKNVEFYQISSAITSFEGMPDFMFHIFDDFTNHMSPYIDRYEQLIHRIEELQHLHDFLKLHPQYTCSDGGAVLEIYEKLVNEGAEGVIIRSPTAVYKSGRSTVKEQILLKLKPLHDAEAKIIGFLPLQSNQNVANQDLFGLIERSSKQAGLVEQDTLGSLVVSSPEFGEFSIGTGFTQSMRDYIWRNRHEFEGELVTFTYQKIGMKKKPRFPSFLRMRNIRMFREKDR